MKVSQLSSKLISFEITENGALVTSISTPQVNRIRASCFFFKLRFVLNANKKEWWGATNYQRIELKPSSFLKN